MNTRNNDNDPETTDISTDPKVLDVIREVKGLLLDTSKEDIANKYRAGQAIERVRTTDSNEKYGKKAVSIIARAVGLSAARLYQYADVARTWDKGTFNVVGLAAAKAGLTFSHFVELAHDGHSAERDERLKAAIDKKLSVRQVRALRIGKGTSAPTTAGVKRADVRQDEPTNVDILDRIKADGMTNENREALDAELQRLYNEQATVHARIEVLEAARAKWTRPEDDGSAKVNADERSDESGADLGKAAE